MWSLQLATIFPAQPAALPSDGKAATAASLRNLPHPPHLCRIAVVDVQGVSSSADPPREPSAGVVSHSPVAGTNAGTNPDADPSAATVPQPASIPILSLSSVTLPPPVSAVAGSAVVVTTEGPVASSVVPSAPVAVTGNDGGVGKDEGSARPAVLTTAVPASTSASIRRVDVAVPALNLMSVVPTADSALTFRAVAELDPATTSRSVEGLLINEQHIREAKLLKFRSVCIELLLLFGGCCVLGTIW